VLIDLCRLGRPARKHPTEDVLAYVLADHKDAAFLELKALLEPFGITQFYTDGWGAYERHIDPAFHAVGKVNTQNLNLGRSNQDLSELSDTCQ
jgi:IS1 family transposase